MMVAIRKPSEQVPVKCESCNGRGEEKGLMGSVVCSRCFGVGYTFPDGEPLDDHIAIRLLKREANHWRDKADKATAQLDAQNELVTKIKLLISPPPEVYVSSDRRQVYHGD